MFIEFQGGGTPPHGPGHELQVRMRTSCGDEAVKPLTTAGLKANRRELHSLVWTR